jgi:hypothetical protein
MKITTRNGELDLPEDFSVTLERHNPLLSGEGDSSIPVTLPASTRNLAVLGHRDRIDRNARFTNKVDAILQAGPVQKRGQLVIDTLQRHNGIDAVFAIDNSDLYVASKDKTLKEIFESFSNNDGHAGYTEVFASVRDAVDRMQQVYKGDDNHDYKVFPVAVSKYKVEGKQVNDSVEVYQYNNEDDGTGQLVYEPRIVMEDNIHMLVPEGYGIAPFLKLQRLLERLFQCLGYTVAENFFNQAPYYSQICIVHNCADCLVTPVLHYSDLVPSCTLGEFLDWLLAKFLVQPIVDSETKSVRIVTMEDALKYIVGNYDLDLTGLLDGEFKVQLNPSKRIVLRPSWEIEGTEPAAETFDKLIEKYGGYVETSEAVFGNLEGDNPSFNDCLVLRKATGQFYVLERDLAENRQTLHRIGSNHFTYDRQNSEETEEYTQSDLIPLMLCGDKAKADVAPYIGNRIHRHTTYENKEEEDEQKIIAVQANSNKLSYYPTTATTQNNIPSITGNTAYNFWFGMDNHTLYQDFWEHYNNLLLNCPVKLKGRLKLDIAKFLSMGMCSLKLLDGQRLLPISLSAQIGDKMGMTEAEFLLHTMNYTDPVSDTQPHPANVNPLKWRMDNSSNETTARSIYNRVIYIQGRSQFTGFTVRPKEFDSVWIGMPTYLGETRNLTVMSIYTIKVKEKVTIGQTEVWYDREYRYDGHYDANGNLLDNNGVPWTWLEAMASYDFTAVANSSVIIHQD